MASGPSTDPPDVPQTGELLSRREREIVTLVVEDLTNAQIAWRLGISDRTVQEHVRHALEKTGARSRVGLAVYGLLNGLAGDDG